MTEARLVRRISGSVNSALVRKSSSSYSRMQMAVSGDAGESRIDHVFDAGHGQRGLGDVGGQHDPAVAVPLEDPVLLGGRQAGVQREDLGVLALGERFGGVADLPLAAEEDQDVAGALGAELVDGLADRLDLVVVLGDRPVAHLDGVGPP
jgi:hypothetical protein